jgi:serine/threonine protein kinase/tetratricopeptide (TPR) repeat protein
MRNWLSKVFGGKKEKGQRAVAVTVAQTGEPNAPKEAIATECSDSKADQPATPPDWQVGGVILGDYRVHEVLGEGGMGKVYLLRSRTTGAKFAVKRAKGLNEDARKNFLAELQTWIDLPEHRNLVSCRFFQTLRNEVLIFAEYVEGGSLKEWIDSRKLYEGGPQGALERMLDVAIQFAWGLHCVHELGVIHQDVKPGNVLMGSDEKSALQGVRAKVTDYGMARARAAAGERHAAGSAQSILVSSGGGTPAYWSPEQAQGLALTRRTDVWSWGVSVLEMFAGGVSWMLGQGAAEALELHVQEAGHDAVVPAMPARLADLLRTCFRRDAAARPASLADAVDTLKAIYQESVGTGYSRTLEAIKTTPSPHTGLKQQRHTPDGAAWTNPQVWLERALLEAGRDPAEAVVIVSRRGVTRRADLVAELAVFDEAKRLYEQLVKDRKGLAVELAILCMDKALVHTTSADFPGALQEYDQAIAIRERLVNQDGQHDLANDLATTYMNKAIVLLDLGENQGAAVLYDQVIAIRDRLVNQEGQCALAGDLGIAYMNKANLLQTLGDYQSAVMLYNHTMALLEQLVHKDGRGEFVESLARTYSNKALALRSLGDLQSAVTLYDQAITICERSVHQEGRQEMASGLGSTYMNKGITVSEMGDPQSAVVLYNQAIALWEGLVNREGHGELASKLAGAYTNKAIALTALSDYQGALALHDSAIGMWRRLVDQEGRHEFAGDLARSKALHGYTLMSLHESTRGLQEMRLARSALEFEIARSGRADLKRVLAWLQEQLARSST